MFAGRVLRRRGFTILEVMMASAVMAFALSSAIIVMQRALSLQDSARNITVAGQILQAEFEKMRLKDWTVVGGYEAGPTQLAANSLFGTVAGLGERFTVQRQVNTPQADMREIVLTATWRAYDGRTVSHSMKTHYGRFGLYDYYYNNGDSGAGSVEPDKGGSGSHGGGGSGQGVDNSGGPSGGGGRDADKDDGPDNDKGDDKREGRDDDKGDTKGNDKGDTKGTEKGSPTGGGLNDDKVVIKVDDKRDGRGETNGRGDDQDDRRRSDEDDRRRDDEDDRDGKHDGDDKGKDSRRDDRDSRENRKSRGDDSDRRRSDDERDGKRDERSKDKRSDRDRRGDGNSRRNDSDRRDHDRGDHEQRDDDQRGHDRREEKSRDDKPRDDKQRDDDRRDSDRRESDRKDDDRRDDDRREDPKHEDRERDDRQVSPGPEKEADPDVRDQRGDLKKSDAVEAVESGTRDGNVASKTDGQRLDENSVDRKDEVPKTESRLLFRIQDLIRAAVTLVVEAVERNRSDDDSRDPKNSAEREGQEKTRVDAAAKEQRGRD